MPFWTFRSSRPVPASHGSPGSSLLPCCCNTCSPGRIRAAHRCVAVNDVNDDGCEPWHCARALQAIVRCALYAVRAQRAVALGIVAGYAGAAAAAARAGAGRRAVFASSASAAREALRGRCAQHAQSSLTVRATVLRREERLGDGWDVAAPASPPPRRRCTS